MKKFFKFLGSAALLCATVAGGIFAYKKFFASDPFEDDLDEDLEEGTADETSERGYVSLSSTDEEESEKVKTTEAEEVSEEATQEASLKETTEE